jgi:hypothetical protein
MRRTFLAFALWVLSIFALPESRAADVSIDLFYNNLSGGSWVDAGDYGYGWQPDVAVNDPDWRPYADGYWAYTDYGWTWVSYEDFGWATYHYGRWARLTDYGWVWFPGSDLEWGPAWVSWRFGGNYCGWAPLPPRGPDIVYEGRPIGTHVDIEFDIGPASYNFIDLRYIGEPVLRSHIYAPSYNVTYVNQTVNVTNITVRNNVVYNYGPDYNVLAQHAARPIQRLKIERQQNVDVAAAAKTGGLTRVQGSKLMVAAPAKIEKPAKQMAPLQVKTTIPKDKVHLRQGWSDVGGEKAQAQLKEKIKNEDPKNIPPATAAPELGATGSNVGTSRAGSPGPAAGESPLEQSKGKHGRQGQEFQPGGDGTPMTTPAGGSVAGTLAAPQHGKGTGQHGQPYSTPIGAAESTLAPENTRPMSGQYKGSPEHTYQAPNSYGQEPPQGLGGRHGRQVYPGMTPSEAGPATPGPQGQGAKHRMQEGNPPRGAPPAHGEQGKPEGGKHKKGEKETPPPG